MTLIIRTISPFHNAARLYPSNHGRPGNRPSAAVSSSLPRFSVTSDADNVYYKAELPAVVVDSLEILSRPGALLISGRHDLQRQINSDGFRSQDRTAVSFRHEYSLADNTDWSQATASHEQGVLTVAVPLRPHLPARRITVTSSEGEPASIEIRDGRQAAAID